MDNFKETTPLIEYLPDILRLTRLSRIEAERRLIAYDKLTKHATVYYACLTTVLTLYAYFFDIPSLTLFSIASSITLTLVTISASSQDYLSHAFEMKRCYLELQVLAFRLDEIIKSDPEDKEGKVLEIGKQYTSVLGNCENHLAEDFAKAKKREEAKKSEQKPLKIFKQGSVEFLKIRLLVYLGPVALFGILSIIFWWLKNFG